jgi:ubiquinol-cytochrome c reductase iron-sulfur subunit
MGVAASGGMFLSSMLPTREVASQASIEVDLSDIPPGKAHIVSWQGGPVFIVHRTQEEIQAMQQSQGGKDPQPDQERVKNPEWLIVLGNCTHLGCVPISNGKGWRCPCHGSVFDLSGRILSGPAPRNLEVPPYSFLDDRHILLGKA